MSVKYKRRLGGFLVLIVTIIFCISNYIFAADIQQFSAEMITRAGDKTQNSKVYVSDKKMRNDMAGNIMILRLDKNVMWMIVPSDKMCMEQSLDTKMIPKTSKSIEGEVERVSLGKEMVSGTQAEKFKVTYQGPNQQQTMFQWLTVSGFPIKMEAIDGSWGVEYRNISLGPQADSLFEIPEGFQKVSMPSFGSGSGKPSLQDIMSQVDE
ncbi:MAG: DUF4412 domain-containing protein [Candidatus Omnitrophica bacterium]|nr:DUF4412 domain-containing protein [Candidatus Omnitrophota bacterium]